MPVIAFSTLFSGATFRSRNVHTRSAPRCTMGSSLAPIIKIKDTKSDQTSEVSIEMVPVAADLAAAAGIAGPAALNATLKGRPMPAVLSSAPSSCPPGTSPADFFFPTSTRNTAPVIELGADESLSVSYDVIETTVAGVSSNAPDSVAFWKEKTYKWVQPSDPASVSSPSTEPEIIETVLFEKYFPTAVRNRAPIIKMKPPAGSWDTTAYVTLASEYVSLNEDLARRLSVEKDEEEAPIQASATVEKYFGGPDASKAPSIDIVSNTSVSLSFEVVSTPLEQAKAFLAENGVTPDTE